VQFGDGATLTADQVVVAMVVLFTMTMSLIFEIASANLPGGKDAVNEGIVFKTFENTIDTHGVDGLFRPVEEILDFLRGKRPTGRFQEIEDPPSWAGDAVPSGLQNRERLFGIGHGTNLQTHRSKGKPPGKRPRNLNQSNQAERKASGTLAEQNARQSERWPSKTLRGARQGKWNTCRAWPRESTWKMVQAEGICECARRDRAEAY
jgi:hypothetical protein